MSGEPITMTAHLARHLGRAGWQARDVRATPQVRAVLEWGGAEPSARLLLHHDGAAELLELEDGAPASLTRWEQITAGNVRRVADYIQGAQR